MKKLCILIIPFLCIVLCQNSEAQVSINKSSQAKKDTVAAHLKKARFLFSQGNIQDASRIYTKLMETDPDNKDAVQGWLIANMKRTPTGEEEAIKQLEELSKIYPKNSGIIFFKAFLEAEFKHNEDALKDLDKLISMQPDTATNHILKGQLLYDMKNYNDAIKAFDRAIVLDPKKSDSWGMKAGALARLGKFDDAIISANKGLALVPNDATALYNRACIYCLKGDKPKALADLKMAISMNPAFKESAKKDEDFTNLYNDDDFKKLTM
jgi:tetratricopeptide (TPR) repeat protein